MLGWGGAGWVNYNTKICMHAWAAGEGAGAGTGTGQGPRAWAWAWVQAVGNERTKEGRRPGREAEGASRLLVTGYWWLVAGSRRGGRGDNERRV